MAYLKKKINNHIFLYIRINMIIFVLFSFFIWI